MDSKIREAFHRFLQENPTEALQAMRDMEKHKRRERRERRESEKGRRAAEARWQYHYDHDTLDLY